jgi:hypothetical protein
MATTLLSIRISLDYRQIDTVSFRFRRTFVRLSEARDSAHFSAGVTQSGTASPPRRDRAAISSFVRGRLPYGVCTWLNPGSILSS